MADWQIAGESFFNVVQFTIWGVLTGGIYALVALGLVIINKASGVFNFAHGYMMLLGGLCFWQFFTREPSKGLVFGVSGISALLILGVIASLGISLSLPFRRKAEPSPSKKNFVIHVLNQYRSQLATLAGAILWLFVGYLLIQSDSKDKTLAYVVGAVAMLVTVLGVQWLQGSATTEVKPATEPKQIFIAVGVGIAIWLAMGWLFLREGQEDILRGAAGGFIASVLIGLFIERFAIRPLLGQPVLTAILMTLAVGFILQGTVQLIWGAQNRPIPVYTEPSQPTRIPIGIDTEGNTIFMEIPNAAPGRTLEDFKLNTKDLLGDDIRFRRYLTWGFLIASTTFIGFVLLFQFTPIGLAMRATSENQVLAESVGLRVRLILAIGWAVVATMATIAGAIQGTGPGGLSADLIPALALRVFPAVLLGGLDSITGAFVGGIAIGVIESLSILFISTTAGQEMMPFLVLMIVLMLRPDGLFGQRRIERV